MATQYFCLESPLDRDSLAGYIPWAHKESDTTEHKYRAFIDRRRALHAETAQTALTGIFRLVVGGLSSIIWLFECSQASVPGLVYPHFLEAGPETCGSLYHGCSPLIVELTSPPGRGGVSISAQELTGHGSQFYLQPWRRNC